MKGIYYALKDKNRLALFNAQLPIFWAKKVAHEYNTSNLGGYGKIVKVVVQEQENIWSMKDKNNLISYMKTVIYALEKEEHCNKNGPDYAKGELSSFKRALDWITKKDSHE